MIDNTQQPVQAQSPPDIITQVSKDDSDLQVKSKSSEVAVSGFSRCCFNFWKCLWYKPPNPQPLIRSGNKHGPLLQGQPEHLKGRKCLILDLDETLVHSTFDPVKDPDLVLPIKMSNGTFNINVLIRPGTFEFLAQVGDWFEVVVFTASLPEYAIPLVKHLDKTGCITSLLFRHHCTPLNGLFVKDMNLVGRNLKDIILVDNSPNSFLFQPENAYHIKNFFDDKTDAELPRLTAFLQSILEVEDVRPINDWRKKHERVEVQKPAEFYKSLDYIEDKQFDVDPSSVNINIPKKIQVKAMEKDKNHVETEPDHKNEEDIFYPPKALSERITPIGEKSEEKDTNSSGDNDMEPLSAKESDTLINHKEADTYFENNNNSNQNTTSNSTANANKEKKLTKSPTNAFRKSSISKISTMNRRKSDAGPMEELYLDDRKLDTSDVRFLSDDINVNSPIGRGTELEVDFSHNAHKVNEVNAS